MLRMAGWCLVLVLAVCPAVWATEFRNGEVVSVEADEVIDDDLFVAGGSVSIAGRVEGDVVAAGQSVRVTGPVEGSVMVVGQQVEVASEVGGSVRAAGQNVILSGTVARNVAAGGQTVVVDSGTTIGRDLHVGAGVVDLRGSVGREADLAARTASVEGEVGERLYFQGDNLELGSSARVGGDLEHCCAKKVEIAPGAVIAGETREIAPKERPKPKRRSRFGSGLLVFAMVFAFGAVGLAAAPRVFVAAGNAMSNRPWWNLLVGLLALVAVPIALGVVCITVVGLPLGLLGLALWVAALVTAGVPVGIWLGRWLIGRFRPGSVSPYLGLLVGLAVLAVLGSTPVLGAIAKFLTILFGLGVYARAAKGMLSELRQQPG